MFELFLAMILALACPNQSHSGQHNQGGQVTVTDDTGGETGTIPPNPPPPPTQN